MLVRYTLTYIPSADRILPSPTHLHVKVRNASAIPLRAAYLHGPYTLYAACYPSTFDPNAREPHPEEHGNPEFEPNLKAGGNWNSRLTVPEKTRNAAQGVSKNVPAVTWIIELSSQVIFSTTATVHFELLVGRDERSVDLGFPGLVQAAAPVPGQIHDHQKRRKHKAPQSHGHGRGVFSKAIQLDVDDTASLWNKPAFPSLEPPDHIEHDGRPEQGIRGEGLSRQGTHNSAKELVDKTRPRKRRGVHLVVLTHGLHSNTGSDMLYMKESIDTAVREGRYRARKKRRKSSQDTHGLSDAKHPAQSNDEDLKDQAPTDKASFEGLDVEDDEQVIVRGFSGNTVRTERGVQYLGKRLAKWVLSMTYPDQPFLPTERSVSRKLSRAFTGSQSSEDQLGKPVHQGSSIHLGKKSTLQHDYKVTSISFIGHSLGGLTQTYAIAYIQKHSPKFFEEIQPINFIALASPFLGLSNENPMYVKFALDFGLVGRTGQDLGLAWRAPTMVRSGWDAMIGGIGSEGQKARKKPDPGSKPLLRVLPTGPAHHALKLFRNRTVYSNVVNDGIVPLRTSCLLFLDWSGLGKVEKARRENGFVGTMASWGWAEATGQNSSARPLRSGLETESSSDNGRSRSTSRTRNRARKGTATVPQPPTNATGDDNGAATEELPKQSQFLENTGNRFQNGEKSETIQNGEDNSKPQPQHPLAGLLSFLRPSSPARSPAKTKSQLSNKTNKIYKRSQTRNVAQTDTGSQSSASSNPDGTPSNDQARQTLVRGDSVSSLITPPKTTFFEAAGDILNPPLPSLEFIINPASRPRTIFHDRVYHPEDIPPPPPISKKPSTLSRSFSSDRRPDFARAPTNYGDDSRVPPLQPMGSGSNISITTNNSSMSNNGMKLEEKIARAYHHDLSWRKVLVRLERESHNNIFVRRMFANAYGWPVIKHLCDTHFSGSLEAVTRDEEENNQERARPLVEGVDEEGREVKNLREVDLRKNDDDDDKDHDGSKERARGSDVEMKGPVRTDSEQRESGDLLSDLPKSSPRQARSFNDLKQRPGSRKNSSGSETVRKDSAQWDDKIFSEGTSDSEEYDDENGDGEDDQNASRNQDPHPLAEVAPITDSPGQMMSPEPIDDEEEIKGSTSSTTRNDQPPPSPVALRSNLVVGTSTSLGGGRLQAGTGSLGLGKSLEEKKPSVAATAAVPAKSAGDT